MNFSPESGHQDPSETPNEPENTLSLKIVLPENQKYLSFCPGVTRGLRMVENAHQRATERQTQIGYEHEPSQSMPIIKTLRSKGLLIKELTDDDNPDDYVMVTSPYGMPRREYSADEHFDGTCVHVKNTRELAKQLDAQGFTVVYVGEEDYPERFGVQKAIGKDVIALAQPQDVLENEEALQNLERVALVSQSSYEVELVDQVVEAVREQNPQLELLVEKTVCQEIQSRVNSAGQLGGKCDIVLILSPDKTSGHVQRMAAKATLAGSQAFIVEKPDDLSTITFAAGQTVGLISSISTPPEFSSAVIEYLKKK